ncbi:MAG: cupin domain-containing protein [Chthoniobacterales bacterium]
MKTSIAAAAVMGACVILAGRVTAQDPVKVAPKLHKAILDNERVRVLDTVVKPGEQIPMHQHPDNVIYVVKGGKVRFVDLKGTPTDRELKDGECLFRSAESHAVQNTGTSEIHVLTIELKK